MDSHIDNSSRSWEIVNIPLILLLGCLIRRTPTDTTDRRGGLRGTDWKWTGFVASHESGFSLRRFQPQLRGERKK
jgi:hypothetical protein